MLCPLKVLPMLSTHFNIVSQPFTPAIRPLLVAMESWEIGPVQWIYDSKKENEDKLQLSQVQELRDTLSLQLPLLRALIACKAHLGDTLAEWGGQDLAKIQKRVEDRKTG